MIVNRTVELAATSDEVWQALKLRDSFLYVTRGAMAFRGANQWPEVLMSEGTHIDTKVYLFGWIPWSSHTFEITDVDVSAKKIETEEQGGMIRSWRHTMKVVATSDNHCRYTADWIDLDAGFLTLPIWLFANAFYWYRQRRWRRLARTLE